MSSNPLNPPEGKAQTLTSQSDPSPDSQAEPGHTAQRGLLLHYTLQRVVCPECLRHRMKIKGIMFCCSKLFYGKIRIRLNDKERVMLDRLRYAIGPVTRDEIADMWATQGIREAEDYERDISIYAYRLRIKLEGSGLALSTRHGIGYELVKGDIL